MNIKLRLLIILFIIVCLGIYIYFYQSYKSKELFQVQSQDEPISVFYDGSIGVHNSLNNAIAKMDTRKFITINGQEQVNPAYLKYDSREEGFNVNARIDLMPDHSNGIHISDWDVSNVTDMSNIFSTQNARAILMTGVNNGLYSFLLSENCNDLNLNNWNTVNVNNMTNMFRGCTHFNSNISNWNTTAVIDMSHMFRDCIRFNSNISNWNTTAVLDMSHMFYGAYEFNQPIGNWDTSQVTNMNSMFCLAKKFDQSINTNLVTLSNGESYKAWNTSSVNSMTSMFSAAEKFNQPIGNWDTSQVTGMISIFTLAKKFDQSINTNLVTLSNGESYTAWNTSSVNDMTSMFHGAEEFNQPIGNWDTSQVRAMIGMFQDAKKFDQSINTNLVTLSNGESYIGWNTSEVNSMTSMFNGAEKFNQPIGKWDTSQVRAMISMFQDAKLFDQSINTNSVTLSNGESYIAWNTSSVNVMTLMFHGAEKFNQPIGNWDTSQVTGMISMFQDATSFLNNFSRDSTCDGQDFDGPPSCWTRITNPVETTAAGTPIEKTSTLIETLILHSNSDALDAHSHHIIVAIDKMGQDPTDVNSFLRYDSSQSTPANKDGDHSNGVHISNWNVSAVQNMSHLFNAGGSTGISTDTTQLISYSQETINFLANVFGAIDGEDYGLNEWDTSNVINMSAMFYGSQFNQDIGNWDVSRVGDMSFMFYDNLNFNQDITMWETSPNIETNNMFQNATSFLNNFRRTECDDPEFLPQGGINSNGPPSCWTRINNPVETTAAGTPIETTAAGAPIETTAAGTTTDNMNPSQTTMASDLISLESCKNLNIFNENTFNEELKNKLEKCQEICTPDNCDLFKILHSVYVNN